MARSSTLNLCFIVSLFAWMSKDLLTLNVSVLRCLGSLPPVMRIWTTIFARELTTSCKFFFMFLLNCPMSMSIPTFFILFHPCGCEENIQQPKWTEAATNIKRWNMEYQPKIYVILCHFEGWDHKFLWGF